MSSNIHVFRLKLTHDVYDGNNILCGGKTMEVHFMQLDETPREELLDRLYRQIKEKVQKEYGSI